MNKMTEETYVTLEKVLEKDERTIVLLAQSGIGIMVDLSGKFPGRFVDVGIMEQSMVGMASGMAVAGMIPIIYGQSTFIIERAYEQLKLDFGYQKLGGNFVVYGGSTEYGNAGATHCCPAALGILSMIPGMEIVVPGRPEEFTSLFMDTYDNGNPTVYRVSLFANSYSEPVQFGKANVVKKGSRATVVAIGPMLELAMRALADEDVTILYYSTVVPFDFDTLNDNLVGDKLFLMEPTYMGGILPIIQSGLKNKTIRTELVGYPLEFITNHGYVVDNAPMYGLTVDAVREKYKTFIS